MNKKVAFGTKPTKTAPASLDELVQSRSEAAAAPATEPAAEEGRRRVSVDLPLSLHTQLKMHCFQNGLLITDFLRDLIAAQFKPKS